MTQAEFFKKANTDHLLKMRFGVNYLEHPVNEGDKHDHNSDGVKLWNINKELLYAELATRPHRVRAKDRRKKKLA